MANMATRVAILERDVDEYRQRTDDLSEFAGDVREDRARLGVKIDMLTTSVNSLVEEIRRDREHNDIKFSRMERRILWAIVPLLLDLILWGGQVAIPPSIELLKQILR